MAQPRRDRWANLARMLVVVISLLVSVCVLVIGGAVFWNEIWNIPKLVYTVLPTYVVRDQTVNGVVVENRGQAAAHKVQIRVVDLEEPIQTFTIKTNEAITDKQGDERNITVWLDRIVPGSSVTLYIPTDRAGTLKDYFAVTAEEGRAVSASSQEELNSLLVLGLVGVLALFLMIIGGVIGWILARMSANAARG